MIVLKTGTREWSEHSANCLLGCEHNCRYCYARAMAERFGRLRKVDGGEMLERPWNQPTINATAMGHNWRPRKGIVMFPTAHDITPNFADVCTEHLVKILKAGNRVLIVTKPHADIVLELCRDLMCWRNRIEWRFTITADDDALLSYWEPGAPSFAERTDALMSARSQGYRTSVSVEPMLDPVNIGRLIMRVRSDVTETIWIGKMNRIRERVKIETAEDRRQVERMEDVQNDEVIFEIVRAFRRDPMIRWKDSIRKFALPIRAKSG